MCSNHPYTENFMPPKPDLSFSGLEEFVNEPIVSEPTAKKPVVKTSEAKTSADKPKEVRKNNGAPFIEDWVSDSKEEDVSQAKIQKKTIKPSFAKIAFVKSKEQVKSPRKTTVTQAILMRSGLVSLTTARPANTVQPKTTVNSTRLMTDVFNKAHSIVRRPINNNATFKNSNFNQKVNTIKDKNVNAARPKAVVNAAKPKAVLNVGTYPILLTLNKLMEDMLPLEVTPKEGKSQAEVQSKLFKLTDESHVLLKVPRKNNMYSVDLKNIVPKGGLTCLFPKATSNESKLWHKRLGHINFKTKNKLVKGNLVRGLPTKLFEIHQTCVACQKGKQHRASFNTACYVQNRVLVTKPHNKTPYELFLGRKPALGFMRPFRCPVTILNTIDHLGKFDGKADEGFFVGYSINSKAFRVFNSRTKIVEESMHVQLSENTPNIA
ncbi:ribonuclease H-like domain-containing protein [Tanacetum coccineum]